MKPRKKVLQNINRAKFQTDPKLFKKLEGEIWEFRTKYNKNYYRLLAFWDKSDKQETLVICAHGFIKKTKKTPKTDIEKAKLIMKKYFDNENK